MNSAQYDQCRKSFLGLATLAGAITSSSSSLGIGRFNEDLTQDYAFFRAKDPQGLLLHLCGVHGAEGYVGSLIQQELLQKPESIHRFLELGWSVLFVHAVNPFGMSWCRRVNEKNIDLNRNGIRFSSHSVPQASFLQ